MSETERRLGVIWDEPLVDAAGAWPEQLGLDTCGECDVENPDELTSTRCPTASPEMRLEGLRRRDRRGDER